MNTRPMMKSYLARIKMDKYGLHLVNHITNEGILKDLPQGVQIEATFRYELPKINKATFTINERGEIDTQAAIIMMKPNARITIEWEE